MLNKWVGMGRLTADPELRHTTTGTPVCSFTLAVTRSHARAGEERETDFIDIVAWNKTAEFVMNWFLKGQQVAVTGRLQVRNWEDKNGNKRRSYEIVAEEVFFAESKRETGRGTSAEPDNTPSGGFVMGAEDDGDLPF